MKIFGVVSYFVLAIITAFPALMSGMVYDSPYGNRFFKAYTVASFAAVPFGFFIGHLGFLPYQSKFVQRLVYLPLAAIAHLVVLFILVGIFGES